MADSIFKMKHFQSPGYSSEVATGLAINGPSGDGFVHLMFYRDSVKMEAQDFVRTEVPGGMQLTPTGTNEVEICREDVAKISMPASVFAGLVKVFERHMEANGMKDPEEAQAAK